jgi:hypothetical protein
MSAPRLALSAIVGGIIVFCWGFISWDLLSLHPLANFTNEDAVASAIRANAPANGVYLIPAPVQPAAGADKAAQEKMMEDRQHTGPIVLAAVQTGGMSLSIPVFFLRGLCIDVVGALFVSILFGMLTGANYGRRVLFAALIGLTAGLLVSAPNWGWWGFSSKYIACEFVDLIASWTLAGLAMAKLAPTRS